jgi:hypothetical protein
MRTPCTPNPSTIWSNLIIWGQVSRVTVRTKKQHRISLQKSFSSDGNDVPKPEFFIDICDSSVQGDASDDRTGPCPALFKTWSWTEDMPFSFGNN